KIAGGGKVEVDAADVSANLDEYLKVKDYLDKYQDKATTIEQIRKDKEAEADDEGSATKAYKLITDKKSKPYGKLRLWPGYEYRGETPGLLVTRQIEGQSKPEDVGRFVQDEIPVLVEPLVKFLLPIWYILHPDASFGTRFYLLLVILWSLAVWGLFGGA